MRRLNLILLLSAVTAALAFVISCKETNAERLEKMCGEWVSTGGKPPFTLWEEDGRYRVTVMHRNHKGGSEAETYLVRETEGVLFIETGFAVMMDYDREKDRHRLQVLGRPAQLVELLVEVLLARQICLLRITPERLPLQRLLLFPVSVHVEGL